jgi:hypothetical protein
VGRSDEKTGLSFTTAAGPCQCSHSRVQVPTSMWDLLNIKLLIFTQYLESKSHQVAARQTEAVQKQGSNLYHPGQVVSQPHQWKCG